jgi:hypothetical protein
MPYHYTAYGLNIASDLEYPELVSADSQPADVTISLAEIPPRIERPLHVIGHTQVGEGMFQF